MPEAPQPAPGRPAGEFKARLNRDIAFTIIDEQIQAGVEPAQLTGRGLAKQYGFGSPQTWVTHLKEWRQLRGFAPISEEGVKEAESAPVDTEPETDDAPTAAGAAQAGGFGMISRSEFLQHQEMWNRLLSERESAHAERLKVARLEGVEVGRDEGRRQGQALAEAREAALQERIRRERLEGEREGAQRLHAELSQRQSGDRRLQVGLAIIVGVVLGIGLGGVAVWRLLDRPAPEPQPTAVLPPPAVVTQPPVADPVATPPPAVPTPAATNPAPTPAPQPAAADAPPATVSEGDGAPPP